MLLSTPFHFEEIQAHAFQMENLWRFGQLIGNLNKMVSFEALPFKESKELIENAQIKFGRILAARNN
jgi:hypothetical protein